MEKSLVYQKAYAFSLEVVKVYRLLQEAREYDLSRQLLRCGTSIGANLAEANGAISKADFSAKVSVSYKETLETKYWLSLLHDCGLLQEAGFRQLYQQADEISRMCFAILKSTGRVSK